MKNRTIVQASVIGAREHNEDRVAHWTTPGAVLMSVADGLGGHLHGELAAQVATEVLGAGFAAETRDGGALPDPAGFLVRAFAAAHAAIVREARKRDLAETPRTVIVACVVQDGQAFWAHVGDCRFYLLREGRIEARTRDHTVIQRLIDEGRVSEEAAANHPYRNRLLACLGGYHAPRVDTASSAHLARDDILLLCSDGFWGPLMQSQLTHTLTSRPLDAAIPELVALAEACAGSQCDNISVVAMRWEEADE